MVRSNELVAARKKVGATQADAANVIGCAVNTYCSKENNKACFTIDEVVKLCDFLNIESDREKVFIFLA